jgi:4-hydroxy-3-methylbut-2-enyl diphosphate reductase
MSEARLVCAYIEGSGTREEFMTRFARATSPGFDPDLHLRRIGVANQTTMLARESLAIGEEVGRAVARRYGDEYRAESFRTFDTICSATQDRQDACRNCSVSPLDAMVVIGGYNSSNTISLAALCAERVPTYPHPRTRRASSPRRAGSLRFDPRGPAQRGVRPSTGSPIVPACVSD